MATCQAGTKATGRSGRPCTGHTWVRVWSEPWSCLCNWWWLTGRCLQLDGNAQNQRIRPNTHTKFYSYKVREGIPLLQCQYSFGVLWYSKYFLITFCICRGINLLGKHCYPLNSFGQSKTCLMLEQRMTSEQLHKKNVNTVLKTCLR